MRNIVVTYCMFTLFIYSCGRTADHVPNIIDVDRFANNPQVHIINDIASNIDFIQLETVSESLLRNVGKLQIKDDKIFVLNGGGRHASLLVFDISGKFIRRIGSVGNGPGEYNAIVDFAVCDSLVLVLDPNLSKMILYNSFGKMVNETRIGTTPQGVSFLKGMPVLSYNYPFFARNDGFRISVYDKNLNLFDKMLLSEKEDKLTATGIFNFHTRSFFANVNDTLTFWETRDDAVYKIVDKNRIEKGYIFRYQNPADIEDGIHVLEAGKNEIIQMMEARKYIFFVGRFDGKPQLHRLIYFKETGEVHKVRVNPKNRLLGFFPDMLIDDRTACQLFSLYDYKAEMEKNNISPDNLDPKLQTLLKECKYDDNPCMMLVTLK